MVVGENKRATNIMDGIENTGDVRLHDHRLRLKQRFDIVRKLGQGTYGKVQLGINKKTGQEVAIKTIKKCKIESEADLVRIRREVQIMSSVRHPNIVHIYEVFENSEKMILVMEYCSGGELYDYLSQKKVLEEEEARRLFRQIATAVYYCHIHKICHRDLKLENVLLDDTGSAKIADFGLSNVFKETSLLSTFCGSPLYASPEIVKGTPYIGPEVDCWSLGVLLYTLVYGAMPFDGSNFKRLVRQISNGDYYEPKSPSTASPLIRDMLTVDPLKRADIVYICDHPWVNSASSVSCLELSESLAAQTPVRLDLLLSLAPAAANNHDAVLVPHQSGINPDESCTDLTSSASMPVEPSNSAEKRILELVAEGGEDAIKPSPTRTIVADNKRKLELAMSASAMQRKKERVNSSGDVPAQTSLLDETPPPTPPEQTADETPVPTSLASSATMTLSPAPTDGPAPIPSPSPAPTSPAPGPQRDATREIIKPEQKTEEKPKPKMVVKKKTPSPTKVEEKPLDKQEESPKEETRQSSVSAAAEKLTSLSLAQNAPPATKPKKFSIPGGSVGSFKEQWERRASVPAAERRAPTKPASSTSSTSTSSSSARRGDKALSEDRDLHTVRLQQIGIQPANTQHNHNTSGVRKAESAPTHAAPTDPASLLHDARRSLQNSMAKLVEEKATEESRRRAARDIISSAIRTGKPPVPYGRSSSAGVTSLTSPPATPPAPSTDKPKLFRTELHHKVDDHRNRGVSVERIIPIQVSPEEEPTSPPPQKPAPPPAHTLPRASHTPVRRLASSESTKSEEGGRSGEPIKKSSREFIIPIAVEGQGYVTPRNRSLEPEPQLPRRIKPRRISSLVSGGESEEEDESHMHRLRSSRAARAESVSSGEEDEEDEGFHLLTAENLFSTLLHRVRALTQRLNGEEGPGFSNHPHSLFNNLHQSPFFNSPHLPRRNLLREGWGSRDLAADIDSMFNKSRQQMPRGSRKDSGNEEGEAKTEREEDETSERPAEEGEDELDLSAIELSEGERAALHGLTPALARRLRRSLCAQLPAAAARALRRTLSLQGEPARRGARPGTERPATERPRLACYLADPAAPPRRVSRFLRPDFYDAPPLDNFYVRHKKEKELETQKVLREIREKKSRALEAARGSSEPGDAMPAAAEPRPVRDLLSPVSIRPKERSRSITPFFPILGNIKETTLDASAAPQSGIAPSSFDGLEAKSADAPRESKLTRPKSYPVKTADTSDRSNDSGPPVEGAADRDGDSRDRTLPRESKLLRPRSYPSNGSPSPEKVYVARKVKKDEAKPAAKSNGSDDCGVPEGKTDVEVSFSVTLPRKSKASVKKPDLLEQKQDLASPTSSRVPESNLTIKKYQVIDDASKVSEEKDAAVGNGTCKRVSPEVAKNDDTKLKVPNHASKLEDIKLKPVDTEATEKKGTIKKKIIRKVSSKTKTDASNKVDSNEVKPTTEKKKVTKKVKDKVSDDPLKPAVKKKSVLQSIGQKFEKFTTKSNSPEKCADAVVEKPVSAIESIKKERKRGRLQREQSVPVTADPPTESGLIKRAVTLTDVAALDTAPPNKNAVSKVLGLFKKFESKEKLRPIEQPVAEDKDLKLNDIPPIDKDKPKRPTSLLLNGLSRKNKFIRASSDTTALETEDQSGYDKENSKDDKNVRNSLKMDISRLPRVKKIVPTNSVIEPQFMNVSSDYKEIDKRELLERNGCIPDGITLQEPKEFCRSRSRSRSTFSNSDVKPDSKEYKPERTLLSPSESGVHQPHRNRESTSPDKEDIVDRIRRKSFYSRFNEKKQRRKSSLVGPGAAEYDPLARIHAPATETKYDVSPSTQPTYDLSPGFSANSDVTPSPERYRSLLTDLSTNTRSGLRFDNYGLNDKIDSYRSLDRNDFRKCPSSRNYLDYEQPMSYAAPRYARTKSLLENCEGDDSLLGHSSIPHKYNRTISMYSPGSYATYRPKRTRNSAIILKESEKEPSPENILEKIRQRKNYSISVTRKPDHDKEPLPRSYTASKSEGDGTERSEKAD